MTRLRVRAINKQKNTVTVKIYTILVKLISQAHVSLIPKSVYQATCPPPPLHPTFLSIRQIHKAPKMAFTFHWRKKPMHCQGSEWYVWWLEQRVTISKPEHVPAGVLPYNAAQWEWHRLQWFSGDSARWVCPLVTQRSGVLHDSDSATHATTSRREQETSSVRMNVSLRRNLIHYHGYQLTATSSHLLSGKRMKKTFRYSAVENIRVFS